MGTIDVCIATYHRPAPLTRLLESLAAQKTEGLFEYRVIVVDNDARRSAAEVVARFGDGRLRVVYDVEPEPNISRARNRALSHVGSDFVAMTDDDCEVAPDWLGQLISAARRYQADVVLGPVDRVLPDDAPIWLRDSCVFEMPNPPSGSTEQLVDNTGNALFRRSLVDGQPEPFDPSFGRTGGEDTMFFHGLRLRGARIVWERAARVHEIVPAERATLAWIVRRSFREGMTSYRVRGPGEIAPLAPPLQRWVRLTLWTAMIAGRTLARAALSAVRPGERAKAVRDLHELAFNLGVAARTLGWREPEHYGN